MKERVKLWSPKSNQPPLMKGTARMSWKLSAQERKIWNSRIFLILIRWNNSRKVESVVLKWVLKKWKSLTSEFTKFEILLYINFCYVLIFVGPLRLWVRIPPETWVFVCCECCALSGRGLCDGLITRPEESYRLWRVVVCDLET
jgi:hypothetical protein